MPSLRHTVSTAGSTSPVAAGDRRDDERDLAAHPRRRPAPPSWYATLGYEAFPLGTNRPADAIGVIFSPTNSPGSLSTHQFSARSIECSLNRVQVRDRVVDRRVDVGGDDRRVDLVARSRAAGPGATVIPS